MRFRHRYKVDPRYIEKPENAGMVFSGKATSPPIMQILEIPSHPCLTSRPLRPQPMFIGLLASAMQKHYPQENFPTATETSRKFYSQET